MESNSTGGKRWRLPAYAVETLLLIFFVLALYGHSIGFGFVGYDDTVVIVNNDSILDLYSLQGLWKVLKPESREGLHEWMPLKNLSLALDYAILGGMPNSFRPQALLWYILCIIAFHRFVALFLEVLAGRGALKWDRRTRRYAALLAALLFAAHPVHVQSAAWLSSRKDLLMMTFFFAGLYHQVRSNEDVNGRKTGRTIAAMLFYVLALLSKPAAVGFPLIIVVIDAVLDKSPGWAGFIKKHIRTYAAYFVLTLLYTVLYLKIASGPGGLGLQNVAEGVVDFNGTLPQLIGQQLSAYLLWTLWPVKLVHYPLFELSETYLSVKVAGGLVSGLLLVVVALLTLKRAPLAAVAIWLFVAGLLPVIGQAPFKQYYEVRYLLISVAAPALLIAGFFGRLYITRLKIVAYGIPLVLLCFWVALTLRDISAWSSTEALWLDAAVKEPRLWVAHKNLGHFYAQKSLMDKADASANTCLAINPASEECICIKAMTTYYLKSHEEALNLLENSMQYNRTGKIADNIALIYLKDGDKQKALDFYARHIEGRSVYSYDLAHYASFMLSAGEPEKALELYLTARRIRENGAYDYEKEIQAVTEQLRKKAAEKSQQPVTDSAEVEPAPTPAPVD